jgi:hypothetical protein
LNGNNPGSGLLLLVPSGKIHNETWRYTHKPIFRRPAKKEIKKTSLTPCFFISSPAIFIAWTASFRFFRSTNTAPERLTAPDQFRFFRREKEGLTEPAEEGHPFEFALGHDGGPFGEDPAEVEDVHEAERRVEVSYLHERIDWTTGEESRL